MKKIIIINIAACMVLVSVLLMSSRSATPACNATCASCKELAAPKENKTSGTGSDEQVFQFNRIYIKI